MAEKNYAFGVDLVRFSAGVILAQTGFTSGFCRKILQLGLRAWPGFYLLKQ